MTKRKNKWHYNTVLAEEGDSEKASIAVGALKMGNNPLSYKKKKKSDWRGVLKKKNWKRRRKCKAEESV